MEQMRKVVRSRRMADETWLLATCLTVQTCGVSLTDCYEAIRWLV